MFEDISQNHQNNFSSPSNPTQNHTPSQQPQNNQSESVSKPKKKNFLSIYIIAAIIAIIILAIIIVVIVLIRPWNSTNNGDAPTQGLTTSVNVTTEEEDKTTKETLEHYADIKIEGFKTVEDESGTYDALVVTVKNISNERIHVAADIAAKDQEGNILDIKSIYAEGLEPEQSYTFNIFTNSELTKEQLQSAKYEVFKAYIYTRDESETPVEVITETTETSPETTEATPEANDTNITNSNE